jgi:hypothetical protein
MLCTAAWLEHGECKKKVQTKRENGELKTKQNGAEGQNRRL